MYLHFTSVSTPLNLRVKISLRVQNTFRMTLTLSERKLPYFQKKSSVQTFDSNNDKTDYSLNQFRLIAIRKSNDTLRQIKVSNFT